MTGTPDDFARLILYGTERCYRKSSALDGWIGEMPAGEFSVGFAALEEGLTAAAKLALIREWAQDALDSGEQVQAVMDILDEP